jgi:hypothetical protein
MFKINNGHMLAQPLKFQQNMFLSKILAVSQQNGSKTSIMFLQNKFKQNNFQQIFISLQVGQYFPSK